MTKGENKNVYKKRKWIDITPAQGLYNWTMWLWDLWERSIEEKRMTDDG
jgi:hypothetical protein